jgi:anti-anti-sigma factor
MMELSPQPAGSALVLHPAGRIDHTHADAFSGALAPHVRNCVAGGTALVIDMTQVSYISSIGLRVLMVAIKEVKPKGGRMVLAGLAPLVLEVFKISRFDMLFQIYPASTDALAALEAA